MRVTMFFSLCIFEQGSPKSFQAKRATNKFIWKYYFLRKCKIEIICVLDFGAQFTVYVVLCVCMCVWEREIWVAHVCLRNFCSVQHCQCVCVFFRPIQPWCKPLVVWCFLAFLVNWTVMIVILMQIWWNGII